jgi:hypothetical protein
VPDEPYRRFVTLQRKLVIHFAFKIPEQTQIKALEDVTGMQRESDHINSVICQQL